MVDYREILRLQSLGHNITHEAPEPWTQHHSDRWIAAQLPQHRKRSRTACG